MELSIIPSHEKVFGGQAKNVWGKYKSFLKGGVILMLDLTWKIFSMTGNIDTYLLFKEFERESSNLEEMKEEQLESKEFDSPMH